MAETTPVFEAKRWVEKAPTGGSKAQVFELRDGRHVIVKFPENPQGERVLANEFLSCALAQALGLAINRALLVSIDGRLLKDPQARGECPSNFTAGIQCGMLRFSGAVGIAEQQLRGAVDNYNDIHGIHVFDALIARGDGRQLLAFPAQPGASSPKRFAAIDYGFAFGGSPVWAVDAFKSLPPPSLPSTDPCTGQAYKDAGLLKTVIESLKRLTHADIGTALNTMHAPRWGVSPEELQALPTILDERRRALIEQYHSTYTKQLEAFDE